MELHLPKEVVDQIASSTDPYTFAQLRQTSPRFRDTRIPQTTRAYLQELDHYTSLRTLVLSLDLGPRPEGPMSFDYFLNHIHRLQHATGLRQDPARRFNQHLQILSWIGWWPTGCTVEFATVHDRPARIIRLERSEQLQKVRDQLEQQGLRICHRCCRTVPKLLAFRRSRQLPCLECRGWRLLLANRVWLVNRSPPRSEGQSPWCLFWTYICRLWWLFWWIAFFPLRVLEEVLSG